MNKLLILWYCGEWETLGFAVREKRVLGREFFGKISLEKDFSATLEMTAQWCHFDRSER